MFSIIIFLPFFGFFFNSLFGFILGKKGSFFLTTFFVFVSFIFSCYSFYLVGLDGNIIFYSYFPWVHSATFYVNWAFLFDSLTCVMLVVVTFVSFLVHVYSFDYIKEDPHFLRFISYLSLFTFFMLLLVSADNFLQMFIGWEGVGLCSFLLINFWFTRVQANKAAIKAILVNRVGDFGLALGLFIIYIEYGTFNYATVFSLVPFSINKFFLFFNFEVNFLFLLTFFLFIGAVGKSAQIGLHCWLPDAIEGPTPVSALIHAATMVTAGVFLLVRCSPLFEFSVVILKVVTFFGAFTAFFGASTGLFQNDIKKVVAYSTCSQLGYIIFACGISAYNVGVFHLANHAIFKALLFLTAGSIIHSMSDEQDIRKIGGLVNVLPFSYLIMLLGSLALAGFPFFTGFYSKDLILENAFGAFTNTGHFAFWLGSFGAFFTAFYSMRLIFLVFLIKPMGFKKNFENLQDSSFFIGFSIFFLYFGSVFLGYLSKDMFVGLGSFFWKNAIFIFPANVAFIESEFLPIYIKIIPFFFFNSRYFFRLLYL